MMLQFSLFEQLLVDDNDDHVDDNEDDGDDDEDYDDEKITW